MAKLYFNYSTMNAGKTTALLQAAHNYQERGMDTYLLTTDFDDRDGDVNMITSRIGIEKPAHIYNNETDIFKQISDAYAKKNFACIFVEEAQWLTSDQAWQLSRIVDELHIPVMCYGIRVDFRSQLFPGSETLMAIADEMRELKTICHCGKKATMVVRKNQEGIALLDGPQVLVGGNDTYESLCRKHWKESTGTT